MKILADLLRIITALLGALRKDKPPDGGDAAGIRG